MDDLREASAHVARRARYVAIDELAITPYAAAFTLDGSGANGLDAAPADTEGDPEALAAYWLTLDAINFGSGWFPTLRKREGPTRSASFTLPVSHKSSRRRQDDMTTFAVIGETCRRVTTGAPPSRHG
jgi:hypothetical protein